MRTLTRNRERNPVMEAATMDGRFAFSMNDTTQSGRSLRKRRARWIERFHTAVYTLLMTEPVEGRFKSMIRPPHL